MEPAAPSGFQVSAVPAKRSGLVNTAKSLLVKKKGALFSRDAEALASMTTPAPPQPAAAASSSSSSSSSSAPPELAPELKAQLTGNRLSSVGGVLSAALRKQQATTVAADAMASFSSTTPTSNAVLATSGLPIPEEAPRSTLGKISEAMQMGSVETRMKNAVAAARRPYNTTVEAAAAAASTQPRRSVKAPDWDRRLRSLYYRVHAKWARPHIPGWVNNTDTVGYIETSTIYIVNEDKSITREELPTPGSEQFYAMFPAHLRDKFKVIPSYLTAVVMKWEDRYYFHEVVAAIVKRRYPFRLRTVNFMTLYPTTMAKVAAEHKLGEIMSISPRLLEWMAISDHKNLLASVQETAEVTGTATGARNTQILASDIMPPSVWLNPSAWVTTEGKVYASQLRSRVAEKMPHLLDQAFLEYELIWAGEQRYPALLSQERDGIKADYLIALNNPRDVVNVPYGSENNT